MYCSESGEWGGHPELYAASQCLGVNIVVHQAEGPRFVLTCELSQSQSQSQSKAPRDVHLSYHGECHYNSVRLGGDPDIGPAAEIVLSKEGDGAARAVDGAVSRVASANRAPVSASVTSSSSSSLSSSSSSAADRVGRAVPWLPLEQVECICFIY
jgi:hypothetical protein